MYIRSHIILLRYGSQGTCWRFGIQPKLRRPEKQVVTFSITRFDLNPSG
jgi:hypothetical protein